MAKKPKEPVEKTIQIQRLQRATVTLYLLSTTALLMNRMAEKARQILLLPDRSENKAAKEQTEKHDPPFEFRSSVYKVRDEKAPTLLHLPSGAFKKALAQAALDMPGATKAEIGRLVKVLDETVHVYGKPYLHMGTVRQAGIARTPDIRTRAILKQWCCKITVQFIRTKIREQDIVNLADAAGDITGVGDGRTEKGTFDYGSWELVQANDPRWHEVAKNGGRKVQQLALDKPEAADEETEELLSWYHTEIIRRESDRRRTTVPTDAVLAAQAPKKNGRGKHANS
jgi:hypothetical protein